MHTTCPIVLAACAAIAAADITLIEETRIFEITAQGDSDFGGDQDTFFEFGSSSNDDPFAPWNVGGSVFTNGAQSAEASASGQFLMDIDPDGFYSSGSLNASATILDETGYNAFAIASASMGVTFSLESQSLWRLTGESTGAMLLTLRDANGSYLFYHDTSGIDQTYLLGPGDYTLGFISTAAANTFGIGTVQDASTLNAAFVLVPAPGTLTLLGIGGLAATRRRSGP